MAICARVVDIIDEKVNGFKIGRIIFVVWVETTISEGDKTV